MNALLLLAQEGGEDATRLVLPTEIDEIIFGAIAFFIVVLFLGRLAFPAMRTALKTREDTIRGELERAEQARVDAEEQREEYRRRIADARSEADRMLREANEAAEEIRRERIARAEDEARQIIEKARADASQERDRAFADLQRVVADISMEAATKVVERELSDPQSHRALVERFIAEVGSGNGGRG